MYNYKTESSVQIFHNHKIRFSIECLCDYLIGGDLFFSATLFEARPDAGFPPSCETHSYKTRESTCCSAGASSSYVSTQSVTKKGDVTRKGNTPSC